MCRSNREPPLLACSGRNLLSLSLLRDLEEKYIRLGSLLREVIYSQTPPVYNRFRILTHRRMIDADMILLIILSKWETIYLLDRIPDRDI